MWCPGHLSLVGVGRPAWGRLPWRSAGHVTGEEEFVEFAGAVSARLQGMAFLLCGDWHTAEDLVQATLVKVFVSWRRIRRQETAHAYATRTLVNTHLAHKRLKRTGEIPTSELPERAAELAAPETRIVVLAALREEPKRPGTGQAAGRAGRRHHRIRRPRPPARTTA